MILSFFSSQGWESWDVGHRPLIPEGMPVLIDDDLRFEDGPGAPRPSVVVNQWLRELPSSGAPSPKSWEYYARAVKEWREFLAVHGVGLLDSRVRLKQALGKYAGHRAAGPVAERLAATTWAQHMSILSLFYRWAISEGHAEAEPFTYRTARALLAGTGREVRVNLAVRRMPRPHVTVKYLEPDFTELFLNGLRGLGADDGYRGRELARNAAIGELTTLPGWRQFVAAVPSIPDLLPGQDWLSLEDGKRAAHDEERLEHHSRLVVVHTPVIGRIVKRGGDLIRMNRLAHYGRSGLMVSGPARTGKTTAVTQLGKTAEVMHRHRSPGSRDDIPVIYITVPPAATGKMIATEIARFPGLPVPRRANITDVIEQVCGICLDTRVTMIIVDELHNLDMSTRAGAEASDTLKYFSERLPATFVYAGIGLDRGALLAGPRGDQVAGRFTLIPASAFTPGQEWATLVAAIEGEPCGSTATRTVPSSRSRTTCTAAPAA
jgi:hypothetical protein